MSKCVAEQFAERILSLELVDPNPQGQVTIAPLPTMERQDIRQRVNQTLVDYARWAGDIERVAASRKIELTELEHDDLNTMITNLAGNIELTQPRGDYTAHSAEQLRSDYALVQAGFALANRRLEQLNSTP